MRISQVLLASAAVVSLSAVPLFAGCGGGDTDDPARAKPGPSRAEEPPRAFVRRLVRLLETTTSRSGCAELDAIDARSLSRFGCPPPKSLTRSMASFRIAGAAAYGTGGVVDYESGEAPEGATIVMYVAPDGSWAISRFGVVTERSVGTSDETSRPGFDRAVARYLAAVEERDCEAYAQVTVAPDVTDRELCRAIADATAPLAARLRANPAAVPRYQGGNRIYGFYSLETREPRLASWTISVVRDNAGTGSRYVVLDAAPSIASTRRDQARRGSDRRRP